MITLLISSAGRRVELLRCFRSDAEILGLDLRIIALDMNTAMSSACQAADKCFNVSHCSMPEFVPGLIKICTQESVNLVVPTIDTELQTLAEHQAVIRGNRRAGCGFLPLRLSVWRATRLPPPGFSTEHGLPAPRTTLLGELLAQPGAWKWPVMLKPLGGSSSVGIRCAKNIGDAELAASERADYVVQEFLRGREFTVNLFFDKDGTMRAAVPHHRQEIRAGEVSKGTTERQPALMEMAWRLGAALKGAYGPLCFQAIVSEDGQARIFEINARFGGGYPLAHQAGATFTRWLLEETAGLPSSANDNWEEGVTMLRYDAALFRRAHADT